MGSSEWWRGLAEALEEASFEWWRGCLQIAGAAVGFGIAWHRDGRFLIFMLIGAIYGTLAAGLLHHWREVRQGDADAWRTLSVYLGATAGFTYRFFLSGGYCDAARLVFSPFYAGIGALVGFMVGSLVLRRALE